MSEKPKTVKAMVDALWYAVLGDGTGLLARWTHFEVDVLPTLVTKETVEAYRIGRNEGRGQIGRDAAALVAGAKQGNHRSRWLLIKDMALALSGLAALVVALTALLASMGGKP